MWPPLQTNDWTDARLLYRPRQGPVVLLLPGVRGRGHVLADRLQRGQHPQPVRGNGRRLPVSHQRAGPAANPSAHAQPRRYRHFPHHPVLYHPLSQLRDLALHHSERALSRMAARPWTVQPGGVVLAVRLTPRGGRDAIDGIEVLADGRCVLKARVRVPASEGEANAALIRLIARALGIAPRAVTLLAGETARVKRLQIAGSGDALAATLEKLVAIG